MLLVDFRPSGGVLFCAREWCHAGREDEKDELNTATATNRVLKFSQKLPDKSDFAMAVKLFHFWLQDVIFHYSSGYN